MLDAGLFSMYVWGISDREAKLRRNPWDLRRYWEEDELSPFTFEERDFIFHDWGWETPSQSWQQFESAVKKRFSESLDKYRDRLEKLAADRGFQYPKEIRRPLRFEWLALYQAKGWSPQRIGRDGVNSNTIFKGVTEAAELFGLKLRPSKKDPSRAKVK